MMAGAYRAWSVALAAALLAGLAPAGAFEVRRQGDRLVVTGENFRYTWSSRRGGELAVVEQRTRPRKNWWTAVAPAQARSQWMRVNSTFAWKSLDTIPALSFSTQRGAYYSGDWTIAYANADKRSTIKVLKQAPDEVVFETRSNPRILENRRLKVPWQVAQTVRVLDSGVVLTDIEIRLPAGELYELDWSQMSINLDDALYKEPHPDRQASFRFGWAYPGEPKALSDRWKTVLQDLKHLPLDIDVDLKRNRFTNKPILFGSAAYDLTHVKGAAAGAFAEGCLAEARSLVGTKEDFGSYILIRPQSGMSPVPTWEGSMRPGPCFNLGWNLFDGKTRGLNEPLTWRNTMTFAVALRKRSSRPDAPADDRNVLLGARVYYARDKLPTAEEVKAMSAEGCGTLLLGPAWRADAAATAAAVRAAHAAGLRVGATVDAADLRGLVADDKWFSRVFEKGRDGLLVTRASFLANAVPAGAFPAGGRKVSFRRDGAWRADAASFAVCMRALRAVVGRGGFLIGQSDPAEPTLLSLAEFDLHASTRIKPYRWNSAAGRAGLRYRTGAGFAPIVDSLPADLTGLAAMHADTPIVLWPAKDKAHLPWWRLCRRLPGGFRVQGDLLPNERRFTLSSPDVHGTGFDGGGKMVLLLSAEKAAAARVTFDLPLAAVRDLDGKAVAVRGTGFDAGSFSAWQVKGFEVALKPAGKEAGR